MTTRPTRSTQRGSAMLVTMIIISSLLAGAAVLVSMQLAANKSTDLTRTGLAALYCAEAGLIASQPAVIANYANWNTALCKPSCAAPAEPTWLNDTVFSHRLDGAMGGPDDFTITLKDDDDEAGTNDPTTDINKKVFIVSTCNKYPDTPKQVEELILYVPVATCYSSQEGGCNGRGNGN